MSDITELNVETGKVTVRSYTEQEIEDRQTLLAQIAIEQEKLHLAAAAKEAVLKKLGLTQDEANILLS